MKCTQCNFKFCWICGQGSTYAHYLPFNPLGCPGMLSKPPPHILTIILVSPSKRRSVVICMVFNFLFLPLTMLLFTLILSGAAAGGIAAEMNFRCFRISKSQFKSRSWLYKIPVILLVLIEICIFGSLACAATVILVAVAIVPTYIIQTYKIGRILRLWCCKSNDQKKQSPANTNVKIGDLEA